MTKQEFDLKYRGEKVAVHCDTEEKAKRFLSLAHSFGYTWPNGTSLNGTHYDAYGNQTVYYLEYNKIKYGGIDGYCKENDYTIVEFTLDEPKETFSVGDVVYAKGSDNPLIILRKAWVVCYIDKKEYEHFADERYLTHQKPLKEITEKELANMGYVIKK